MTPINNPVSPAARRYNNAHVRTRNTIERAFGVLKSRFPCLHFGLRLKLKTTFACIIATTVLHNLAILRHENLDELEFFELDEVPLPNLGLRPDGNGHVRRQILVQHFDQ